MFRDTRVLFEILEILEMYSKYSRCIRDTRDVFEILKMYLRDSLCITRDLFEDRGTGILRNSQLIRRQRSLRVARNCELRGIPKAHKTVSNITV